MSQDRTYNGWTNYETWVVGLYLDWDGLRELFVEEKEEEDEEEKELSVYKISQRLKEMHENDFFPEGLDNGLYCDLLRGALSEVNWFEIAKHVVDE